MPAVDPHFPSRLFCFGVRLEGSLHAEAGFTEVYVANMGPHYADMIAAYGSDVLPQLRG